MSATRKAIDASGNGGSFGLERWLEFFDGMLGGSELHLPGNRNNVRTMARDFYLMGIKQYAPQVTDDLQALTPLYEAALRSQWAIRAPDDEEPPARCSSNTWLISMYCNCADRGGEIVEYDLDNGEDAVRFILALYDWAQRYRLEVWTVEEFMPALLADLAQPDLPFGVFVGNPSTGGTYPLEAEVYSYEARQYSVDGGLPSIRKDRRAGRIMRSFRFSIEGYDPGLRTRAAFEEWTRRQFEHALKHYADGVEEAFMAQSYIKCPQKRKVNGFKFAVLRRVLGMSLRQIVAIEPNKIIDGNPVPITVQAVTQAIKDVEDLMGVPHMKITQRRTIRRGERPKK